MTDLTEQSIRERIEWLAGDEAENMVEDTMKLITRYGLEQRLQEQHDTYENNDSGLDAVYYAKRQAEITKELQALTNQEVDADGNQ